MPIPTFSSLSKVTQRFTFECMRLRTCRCSRWSHHHCRVSFAEKPQREIPLNLCLLCPHPHSSHNQSVLKQVLDGVGDAAIPGFAVQAK